MRIILSILLISMCYGTVINVPAEYSTIQSAIDATTDGDTVRVSADEYVENINFNGKNIAVIGEDRETTIIDGNQSGSVVMFESGEDSTAILSGFTITNGSGYINEGDTLYLGGGIYIDNANPIIEYNIIKNNNVDKGGGIYKEQGVRTDIPSIIRYNTIQNNTANGKGGGIYITRANSIIYQNNIHDNQSIRGAGIYIIQSNPYIIDNIIYSNTDSERGGGIYIMQSTSLILNNLIYDNSASVSGSGVHVFDASPYLIKNTIYGNTGSDGIYITTSTSNNDDFGIYSHPEINSCIVWGNDEEEILTNPNNASSVTVSYSNIEGGWLTGDGNINIDPQLNADYCPVANALIGTGDPTLPVDSTGFHTDIGYSCYFDWEWSGILDINFSSDNFMNLIWEIRFNMPGEQSDGYLQPDSIVLETWGAIIDTLISQNPDTIWLGDQLETFNYEFVYDFGGDYQGYYIIYEKFPIQKGWGTFVYNSNSDTNLQIHVNHPVHDYNTHIVGAKAFQNLNAQWFLMAGTHRYANCATNNPNGNGCTPDDDCVSDMARNPHSVFQQVFETAFDGCDYTISFHSFSDADDYHDGASSINLSHGSTEYCNEDSIVVDILDEYCFQIESNTPTTPVTCCHVSPTDNCGHLSHTNNPQGLFINNTAYEGHWIGSELVTEMNIIDDIYSLFIANSGIFLGSLAGIDGECAGECSENLGDMNGDGAWNVMDVVQLVDCIVENNCANHENGCAGDINGDGAWNVMDVVQLVACIMLNNCDEELGDIGELLNIVTG